jgi:hypothetical protein
MGFIVSFLGWFGTAITWIIKTFIPSIAKRFGLGAITGIIQQGVSVVVVTTIVAFFGFVVYFITQIYSAFRDFLTYISTLPSGGQWGSAFLHILNASGIASGFRMAMPFMISVLVFYFGYAAYKLVLMVLKTISDETAKTTQSFK